MALNVQARVLFGKPPGISVPVCQHGLVRSQRVQLLSAAFRYKIETTLGVRYAFNESIGDGLSGCRQKLPSKQKHHAGMESGIVKNIGVSKRKRTRCSSAEPGEPSKNVSSQQLKHSTSLVEALQKGLQNANTSIPYAVVASTALALVYPPSFTWFTTRYYAPALGFLMFAVGINLSAKAFLHAMERPAVIALGYSGQFVLKPLLGLLVANIAVSLLHLPNAIGSGLLLVSCVSGAQLSNYATYMVDPDMAPLSIVMTALSTITAVVVTPALSLLLLGRRLPVNVPAMMASITQIVVLPVAAGLSLNKFFPSFTNQIRPILPLCSVLVTCCCIGAPLALNITALRSEFGLILVLPIFVFHSLAFVLGYKATKLLFPSEPDVEGLAKTISFETGMQSSLLGLTLANTFFEDTLVSLPSAISTVLMTLMGFGLTIVWQQQSKTEAQ